MIKINAARRLMASWFDSLSEIQKKEYVKEHPNSKYAKGWTPSRGEDVDDVVDSVDSPEEETFLSKLRSKIIESLGGTSNRKVLKTRKGFPSQAVFVGSDGVEKEVNIQYTPEMLKSGDKSVDYGYWKDENTYVQMTKKQFRALNKTQLKNLLHRQEIYGLN